MPARGNYRELRSYRKTVIIYDPTRGFCARFLKRGDWTSDQMVQAARSGKQHILGGAKAALPSAETELKLTNVARASLEERLIDYGDYLRTNRTPAWDKDSREARFVRRLGANPELTNQIIARMALSVALGRRAAKAFVSSGW